MSDIRVEYEFDHVRFMADVRAAIGDKASLRDIEASTGVSASTYSRVDNGQSLDMDAFMRICGRLELTPGNYFKQVKWQRMD